MRGFGIRAFGFRVECVPSAGWMQCKRIESSGFRALGLRVLASVLSQRRLDAKGLRVLEFRA